MGPASNHPQTTDHHPPTATSTPPPHHHHTTTTPPPHHHHTTTTPPPPQNPKTPKPQNPIRSELKWRHFNLSFLFLIKSKVKFHFLCLKFCLLTISHNSGTIHCGH